jgi:hypothetical protein
VGTLKQAYDEFKVHAENVIDVVLKGVPLHDESLYSNDFAITDPAVGPALHAESCSPSKHTPKGT